jgi:hypothetical protein
MGRLVGGGDRYLIANTGVFVYDGAIDVAVLPYPGKRFAGLMTVIQFIKVASHQVAVFDNRTLANAPAQAGLAAGRATERR